MLLFAIGRDCAGALSITAGEASPDDESDAPARIDQVELERLIRARGGGLLRGERQRFSLAGAQDKLPVRIDGDVWYEPDRFHPSTHLVKFETISHVCLSEDLATELAHHAGLTTVDMAGLGWRGWWRGWDTHVSRGASSTLQKRFARPAKAGTYGE